MLFRSHLLQAPQQLRGPQEALVVGAGELVEGLAEAPLHIGALTIDLSPTKHVVYLAIAAALVALTMIWTARRTHGPRAENATDTTASAATRLKPTGFERRYEPGAGHSRPTAIANEHEPL